MNLPQPSQAWIERRRQLHRLLEEQLGFSGNASSLESVGYARTRWHEAEVASLWRKAASRPGRAEEINHVYVHVPFCKSICHFCNYKRLRPGKADLLRRYVDRVRGSLDTLGPAVQGFRFHSLYLGGGTPSLLPAPLLDELLGALNRQIPFVHDAARFLEADPAVLDTQKLEVMAQHGIQHVSLGVQTLTADVNAAHDRGPQTADLVGRRVRELADAGIRGTSLDFLLGLHDTTPEQMFDQIDHALATWRPRWVDVFFLTPTERYVALHFSGSYDAFWEHQRAFAHIATERLTRICARRGYDLFGSTGDAFILRRRSDGAGFVRRAASRVFDRLADAVRHHPERFGGLGRRVLGRVAGGQGDSPWSYNHLVAEQHLPLNLLGLGTAARSRLFATAYLETADPGDDPDRDGPAEYVGPATDMAFECRAWLFKVLRDENRVDGARLRALFGVDLATLLPHTLAAWRQLGLAHLEGEDLVMTPSTRQDRNRALMWLLEDVHLETELAEHRKISLDAADLLALLAPLRPGDLLGERLRLDRSTHGAWVLSDAEGATVRVRASPRLDRTTGLQLVPEQGHADLRTALHRMGRLLARNGADELGVKAVPILRDATFTGAGQAAPAPVDRDRRLRVSSDAAPPPVHDPDRDPARPLPPAQRDDYWRDGFVRPVPVLGAAEVARFRTWLELIEAEQAARHGGRWTDRGFDPDRAVDHPLLGWVDELIRHPRLLDAVESVLGPDLLVRNVDVFVREPRTRDGVRWHRDSAQTGPGTDRVLSAWLGLNPATADNGALTFVAGSHRGTLPGEHLTHDDLELSARTVAALPRDRLVLDTLEAGEASLHHLRTVHASGGNRTPGRRIGVVVRYLAADVEPAVAECAVAVVVRGRAPTKGISPRPHARIAWVG